MSDERDAMPAPDGGRPTFAAPQPVIVPPGSPLPAGTHDADAVPGPATLSVRAGAQSPPMAAGGQRQAGAGPVGGQRPAASRSPEGGQRAAGAQPQAAGAGG
ncbi:hypothetical protein ACFO60_37210, partial [Sphaerisporangium dianthi]